jgi:cytidyltransferase-like protein
MAFGSFDFLHLGHLKYLELAKGKGDYLLVVVSRDSSFIGEKGKKPFFSAEERRKSVSSLKCVDEAIVGNSGDRLRIVEEKKPFAIVLGYDQRVKISELKKELAERGFGKIKVFRAPAFQPEKFKSAKIKKILGL